jgi:hypothetical protein
MPYFLKSWIETRKGTPDSISTFNIDSAACNADTRHSYAGTVWKFARVGERLSPYVSIACIVMAVRLLA